MKTEPKTQTVTVAENQHETAPPRRHNGLAVRTNLRAGFTTELYVEHVDFKIREYDA